MVFKVAELVATLRLDKGNYDSGLADSMARTADLGRQAENTGSALGGALTTGLRSAAVVMTGTATVAAVMLKKVLDTGLAYNGLQQTSRAALRTLLGGAEAANAQMDKLDAFAKTSPFSKSVFIQAQQQLIGFGAAGDKVIPMLSAVNDAVAAIGGSNDDIAAVSGTLADVIGTGKITGDTLNELGLRGINAAEILAKAFGKSAGTIRKEISSGTIDSQKALDFLVAGMAEKYAGAAANVKETIEGARDRVTAATRDIGSALAEPFVSKNGGGRLVQWTNDWADALRSVEKRVPAVVGLMQARFAPQLANVSVLLQNIKREVDGFNLSNLNRAFDGLSNNLPAVAAVAGAVLGLTSGALAGIPVIGGLLGAINPLAGALVAVAAASPELRAAIGELVGSFAPLLPAVGQLAGALSGALNEAIGAVVPLILSGAEVTGALATALVPLIQMVAAAASGFSDLPTGVQAVIVSLGVLLLLKGPITTMFTTIGTAASNLTTKLAAGGLQKALGGILAMFGGPWGLAIGGAVAALSIFAVEQQETKSRVEAFTAALDANSGAISANHSVIAGQKLMEYADAFKSINLNVKDASDAVANGGAPYVAMVQKVDKLRQAVLNYNTTSGNREAHQTARADLIRLAEGYDISADAATNLNSGALSQLLGGMVGVRGEVIQTSEGWKTLNVATEQAEPTTLRLSDAIKTVGDSAANTNDRLRAYQDIIDAMNGKTKSAEQAQRDLSKTSRDLAGFLGEVDGAGHRVNASMAFAADGSIAFNDAGDRLSSMLDPLATRGQAAALAAIDLANAQGRSSDAAKDAEAALKPYRQSLQDLADQGLLTQDQVNRLSDELLGVPDKTTAVITDEGTAEAVKLKVDELTRTIQGTPNKEIIITEPLSPEIMEKLGALGYKVTTLPNGNIKVTETGTVETGAKIDGVAGKARWARIDADANVADAEAALNRAARNRTMIITASHRVGGDAGGVQTIAEQANGGILSFFANGGFHGLRPMKPEAQIVPQNTWRVVGDNMKVPELYAPLDGSARSISLIREGARRSGFDMVPRSQVRHFADGGFFGGGGASSGAAEAQMDRWTADALDRLTEAVRSARQINIQQLSSTQAQVNALARAMEGI